MGEAASMLTAEASVTDAGILNYQWYSNNVNSITCGTEISGETTTSYTPPTDSLGTTYYYVIASNT